MRISDWSSDVCSSDLPAAPRAQLGRADGRAYARLQPYPLPARTGGTPAFDHRPGRLGARRAAVPRRAAAALLPRPRRELRERDRRLARPYARYTHRRLAAFGVRAGHTGRVTRRGSTTGDTS